MEEPTLQVVIYTACRKDQSKQLFHLQEIKDEASPSSGGREKLREWLNRSFRIVMTDGRILVGVFLCTDAEANVILGNTCEYIKEGGEPRFLGLVMVPGRHIVSIEVDLAMPVNLDLNTRYEIESD